jgi:Phage integrase, N-terminal SAM-like domain
MTACGSWRSCERAQGVHRSVPRRATFAPDELGAKHRAHLRAGTTRAITIIAAAKNGDDPAAKRDADRQTITVKELADRFDREHVTLRVKESTAKGYRRMLERVIVPALGRHRVTEVTRADVAKIHHDLRHIPYDANRCIEIISKMFVKWRARGLNFRLPSPQFDC